MAFSKRQHFFAVLTIVGIFFVALPFAALAAGNQVISVSKDQIIDGNFIRAGSSIEIDGNVKGDVIVAGNSITINGAVAGDVIAVGNLIRISGPVGGSIRVAGSTIEINGAVERNVWAAGNTVTIGPNASVGWDVLLGGATVEIEGPVSGGAWLGGAIITIDNKIGKNVDATLDRDSQLILGSSANVSGAVTYHALKDDQLVRRDGATVGGEVTRDVSGSTDMQSWKKTFGAFWAFMKLFIIFSSILVGVILVSVVPKLLLDVSGEMINAPARSLGWGIAAAILVPMVLFLLAITIIGLPITLIGSALYIILMYIAKIIAAFVAGLYILNALSADKKFSGSLMWPLILGVILFAVLSIIPLLGGIAKLLLTIMAFGALIQIKRSILREYR